MAPLIHPDHLSDTLHHLTRRDNMGYAISPIVITLIVMLAAGALVVVGFAVAKLTGNTDEATLPPRSVEQDDYMRDVRSRNLEGLWAGSLNAGYAGPGRGKGRMTGGAESRAETDVSGKSE